MTCPECARLNCLLHVVSDPIRRAEYQAQLAAHIETAHNPVGIAAALWPGREVRLSTPIMRPPERGSRVTCEECARLNLLRKVVTDPVRRAQYENELVRHVNACHPEAGSLAAALWPGREVRLSTPIMRPPERGR